MAIKQKRIDRDQENVAAAVEALQGSHDAAPKHFAKIVRRIEEQDATIGELDAQLTKANEDKERALQAQQDKHTKEIEPLRIKLADQEGKLKRAAIALGDPKA